MPEHYLKITATELKVIRLTCHQCQLTTEMSISKVSRALGPNGQCVHCGTDLMNIERYHPLVELKQALERLEDAAARMQVDFVLGSGDSGR